MAIKHMSVGSSWEKRPSGRWTSQQASTLNPGTPEAIQRRKNSPKFKARTKKVIRPRIRKQRNG